MKNQFEVHFRKTNLVQRMETRKEAKSVLIACFLLKEPAEAKKNTLSGQEVIGYSELKDGTWILNFIDAAEVCECPFDIVRGRKYILCTCGGES